MSKLNADVVRSAILQWPGLYETPDGRRFAGMPVSQVPKQLRECGWRNTSNLDEHSFGSRGLGLEIVDARYVGGASPKRFCRVVVAQEADDPRLPHPGHFGRCRVISSDVQEHTDIIAEEFA